MTYGRQGAGFRLATRLACGVALSGFAALTVSPAAAQAAPPAGSSESAPSTVGTLIVTAERRATNLQKTAIAATVLTNDELTKRSINTVDALQFTTPSLTVQNSGVNVEINIRGIGKSDAGAQVSSGVLIYRDGVSTTPNGLIGDEPYYDIANIEVLRGPQGTFAGQNATGGAIFITETEPSLGRFGGWAEGQYGNYNDVRFRGALNIPLSSTLAIRIATDDENRDTFFHMTGPFTGNAGNLHETNWRVSTLWEPDSHFKAVLKLDYNYIDHGGSPAGTFTGSTANVFNVASDAHLKGLEQQFRAVLQLSYQFADGITLKSISGYQYGHLAYALDADGSATPPPLGLSPEIFVARANDQTISQEINLISPDTSRFTWVLGGVYQDDTLDTPQFVLSLAPGGTTTRGLALNGVKDNAARQSWGVFGQGSYAITNSLKLQLGARYSETTFTLNDIAQVLFFGFPILTQAVNGEVQKDVRLTWKADLDWAFDQNNFLYAFAATGHKGGGINGSGPRFEAENVTDYELGWKGTYFDGALHTQLGGFYEDYKNFQVPIFDPVLGAGLDENATGTTIVKGVEAQIQGKFGAFSFNLGGSYVASRLGQFVALDSRNLALGEQVLTGRPLPNAPPWTAQVGAQYAIDLHNGDTLTPRVDYGYVDARWATVFEVSPADRLAPQNLVNALLTYDRHDNWQVALYATNLFDLHYVSLQLLGNLAMPGPPRQFGIRVSKTF
jgi:iron complex outermembrane receptor protein